MLTAGVLKFDDLGRIILSAEAPIYFNGGTPIAADGGLSALTEGLVGAYLAAIGYTEPGQITDSSNPLVPAAGPVTNDQGQIRISTDLPHHWYAGLPLTVDGFLSTSGGAPPPVDLGAYDHGFDSAFDIGD
jgi:hypothetical protein